MKSQFKNKKRQQKQRTNLRSENRIEEITQNTAQRDKDINVIKVIKK